MELTTYECTELEEQYNIITFIVDTTGVLGFECCIPSFEGGSIY